MVFIFLVVRFFSIRPWFQCSFFLCGVPFLEGESAFFSFFFLHSCPFRIAFAELILSAQIRSCEL